MYSAVCSNSKCRLALGRLWSGRRMQSPLAVELFPAPGHGENLQVIPAKRSISEPVLYRFLPYSTVTFINFISM